MHHSFWLPNLTEGLLKEMVAGPSQYVRPERNVFMEKVESMSVRYELGLGISRLGLYRRRGEVLNLFPFPHVYVSDVVPMVLDFPVVVHGDGFCGNELYGSEGSWQ